MKILVKFFEKVQILIPFSGLAPSRLKKVSTKLRVVYVYIEESFDTIFNMGYGGHTTTPPPRENRPWVIKRQWRQGLDNMTTTTHTIVILCSNRFFILTYPEYLIVEGKASRKKALF